MLRGRSRACVGSSELSTWEAGNLPRRANGIITVIMSRRVGLLFKVSGALNKVFSLQSLRLG